MHTLRSFCVDVYPVAAEAFFEVGWSLLRVSLTALFDDALIILSVCRLDFWTSCQAFTNTLHRILPPNFVPEPRSQSKNYSISSRTWSFLAKLCSASVTIWSSTALWTRSWKLPGARITKSQLPMLNTLSRYWHISPHCKKLCLICCWYRLLVLYFHVLAVLRLVKAQRSATFMDYQAISKGEKGTLGQKKKDFQRRVLVYCLNQTPGQLAKETGTKHCFGDHSRSARGKTLNLQR